MDVERGRLIWELLARPAFEHAAEGWWKGGESNEQEVGIGAGKSGSRTMAGVAVRGELGWWSLEERREEKK